MEYDAQWLGVDVISCIKVSFKMYWVKFGPPPSKNSWIHPWINLVQYLVILSCLVNHMKHELLSFPNPGECLSVMSPHEDRFQAEN